MWESLADAHQRGLKVAEQLDEETLMQFRELMHELVCKGASSDEAWTALQTLLYPAQPESTVVTTCFISG